jgi:hypothetical protein
MKLGMPISYDEDFEHTVDNLLEFEQAGLEFEQAGLDRVMIPEAYGFDGLRRSANTQGGIGVRHPTDVHPDPDDAGDDRRGSGLRQWGE